MIKRNEWRRAAVRCALVCMCAGLAAGCGKGQNGGKDGPRLVLTTGFDREEIFRIENISCRLPEIMVYITTSQNQYEGVFGPEIWEANVEGVTLEQNVKDTALARIAQIKTMNLLAAQHGVELNDQEKEQVQAAASAWYGSLNDAEKQQMNVTQDIVRTMYSEYALANKVYNYIIKDINPEISDDEARTITVQHILIKTYALDGTGAKIEYTQNARADAYNRAKEVLALARDESDFEELIEKYSEDVKGTYSFGKGDMEPAFEEAAFNLETGQISDIVESEFGFHIIKCINTFNREETDANKVKIVEERKKEVFGQEYDNFVESLTRDLNEELWNGITFIHDSQVATANFFDVYGQYFRQ